MVGLLACVMAALSIYLVGADEKSGTSYIPPQRAEGRGEEIRSGCGPPAFLCRRHGRELVLKNSQMTSDARVATGDSGTPPYGEGV